ncbi:MAG: hypothetical protein PHC46_02395 [Clostridia bacterium]|nr:hypothetical protein [Clostridia bacterium]
MELEKLKQKTKCDIPGCTQDAEYALKLRKFWNIGNTNFCKACLCKINTEISKVLTPKSPKNVLKQPKKFNEEE